MNDSEENDGNKAFAADTPLAKKTEIRPIQVARNMNLG